MNFKEMRSELAFLLSFNEGEADQDFATARLKKALQFAYDDEVRQAKLEGQYRWFKSNSQFTWPANQVTFTLSSSIAKAGIIDFWDITSSSPGVRLTVRENWEQGGVVWWLKNDTLQWGNLGPQSDRTIQVDFLAVTEKLLDDTQIPNLMPPEYHWLIVWSAAVYLRQVADEGVPDSWFGRYKAMQMDYWKTLSRGRPFSDVPTVVPMPLPEDGRL